MAPRRSQKVVAAPVPRTTRNRSRHYKSKLITDTEQSTKQLTSQLRSLGLYAAPTLGDGNCLFRALSDQLWGFPNGHLKLRAEICDWMESQRERYEGFVDEDRTFDTHVKLMRISGTYGGHLELSAFAHLKRRNVKVIQPGLVYVIEWNGGSTCDTSVSGNSDGPSSLAAETDIVERTNMSRRDTRRLWREGQKGHDKKKHDKKITAQEESPEPEQQGAVYVAYHDWGHYSSIRSLTGPHTGLPDVVESPSPKAYEDLSSSTVPPRSKSKVTTRVISATPIKTKSSSTILARISQESLLSATPSPSASISRSSSVSTSMLSDDNSLTPSLVPLPPSRSISPLVSIPDSVVLSPPASQISILSTHTDAPSSSHNFSPSNITPATATLGSILAATITPPDHSGRSPKRTFDETEEEGPSDDLTRTERHTFSSAKRHRLRSSSKEAARRQPTDFLQSTKTESNTHRSTPSLSSNESSQDHSPSCSSATPPPTRALRSNTSLKETSRLISQIDTPSNRQKRRAAVQAMQSMSRSRVPRKTTRTSTRTTTGKVSQGTSPSTRILRSTTTKSTTSAVDPSLPISKEEWQKNGSGRIDIRGFRELKI